MNPTELIISNPKSKKTLSKKDGPKKEIKQRPKLIIHDDKEDKNKTYEKNETDKTDKTDEKKDAIRTEFIENKCMISSNLYNTSCNKFLLKKELLERQELEENPEENDFLYPTLNDPNFNIKIAEKKEFNDTKYDGTIYNIKEHAEILSKADFELAPHQAFIRNFMSFQTPYNSLLLFHALGSGKTLSAIGVCEEMRVYLKQMGISKRIIIVASPNVQDNFRLQLFDERKLKLVDGLWSMRDAIGNRLIKEINPMNMKGLTKEKILSQIRSLINSSYLFLGYIEFANYIDKSQQIKGEYKTEKEKKNRIMRNLQNEFDNRLIVIDEVHNIRISDENENKKVAEKLLELVKTANNLRLLLLSATPMYNNYQEIIWLLNLMNINDRRGEIAMKDVFDKEGDFKKNSKGEEVGKQLLIQKATGYVSFVRGENPYTFPFRIYPSIFSPNNSFSNKALKYPSYQMNGKIINDEDKIKILNLFLTKIGSYQSKGYQYVIDSLRKRKITVTTKKGVIREMPSFENMESFGYTMLQLPIEALNIVYPIEGLEDVLEDVTPIDSFSSSSSSSKSTSASGNGEIIELTKRPSSEPSVSSFEFEPVIKSNSSHSGGENTPTSSSSKLSTSSSSHKSSININVHDLTGKKGLHRMMDFVDTKSPPEKGSFEYKTSTLNKYGRIFSPDEVGKYSSKIKNICDNIVSPDGTVNEGVIMIYGQYIDGGILPVVLALEEMGFTRYGSDVKSLFKTPPTDPVDVRTMKPRISKKSDFIPAKYILITGDPRLSPNNANDVKAATSEDNKDGNKIKVVIISQAGAEGVDFKFLRQLHILQPWYNMSRIEQIIGRAVRNFSHKDLPFEKRNVEIFMYGTLLEKNKEESADLYIYRVAEYKAVQIGKVSRILKETAVDCIINHDQTNFTQDIMAAYDEGIISQTLSNGKEIDDFKVGDAPFSAACDYMENCSYKCYPNKELDEKLIKEDTYNETFIMMNSDKIIQKIRQLFKERFFYIKKDLLLYINTPKPYPLVQIYAALTQLIEDSSEYITDKYGRTGYLVNIGEYYLFQPSELNNRNLSIFDRSVPLDFKHSMINIEIKPEDNVAKHVIDQRNLQEIAEEHNIEPTHIKENALIKELKENYELALHFAKTKEKIPRKDDNWYKHCGKTIRNLIKEFHVPERNVLEFLVEHIVDMLLFKEKVELLNYLYSVQEFEGEFSLEKMMKDYLSSFVITTKRLTGIILFSVDKRQIMIYDKSKKKWVHAEPEDEIDIATVAATKFKIPTGLQYNTIMGFIDNEKSNRYLVFKTKQTDAKRNTGARCDEAVKGKKIQILNMILGEEKYTSENTKGMIQSELCSLQEFLLRYYNTDRKNNKIWFLNFELGKLYNF